MNNAENTANWQAEYTFQCSCGELYNSVHAAYTCRKCRNYCVFGYCTHVVDIRDGSVVAGTVPTAEEEAAAAVRAEEERAELKAELEMWKQEGPAWDAHVARLAEQARDDEEDILWALQDELNGFPSERGFSEERTIYSEGF